MDQKRLLELCQWDFLSYEDAVSISPFGTDIIRYARMDSPIQLCNPPMHPPDVMQTEIHEIRVGTKPFGFYSWMPTSKSDRAFILEHKVRPKPWTKYMSGDEGQTKFICSVVETLIEQQGLLAGVSCIDGQFVQEFLVMFARIFPNPISVFVNFSISEQEIFECQNKERLVEYLDFVVGVILRQREDLCKEKLKG